MSRRPIPSKGKASFSRSRDRAWYGFSDALMQGLRPEGSVMFVGLLPA